MAETPASAPEAATSSFAPSPPPSRHATSASPSLAPLPPPLHATSTSPSSASVSPSNATSASLANSVPSTSASPLTLAPHPNATSASLSSVPLSPQTAMAASPSTPVPPPYATSASTLAPRHPSAATAAFPLAPIQPLPTATLASNASTAKDRATPVLASPQAGPIPRLPASVASPRVVAPLPCSPTPRSFPATQHITGSPIVIHPQHLTAPLNVLALPPLQYAVGMPLALPPPEGSCGSGLTGIFKWTIVNFSRFETDKRHYSDKFVIGKTQWQILLIAKATTKDLSMYLSNAEDLPSGWTRLVKFTLRILSSNKPHVIYKKDAQYNFGRRVSDWGFKSFITVDEMRGRGFLESDTLVVEAEVTVLKVFGYWSTTRGGMPTAPGPLPLHSSVTPPSTGGSDRTTPRGEEVAPRWPSDAIQSALEALRRSGEARLADQRGEVEALWQDSREAARRWEEAKEALRKADIERVLAHATAQKAEVELHRQEEALKKSCKAMEDELEAQKANVERQHKRLWAMVASDDLKQAGVSESCDLVRHIKGRGIKRSREVDEQMEALEVESRRLVARLDSIKDAKL